MNTAIPYLYRDSSNYKVHDELVVEGELTTAGIASIREVLIDGVWFDPVPLNLRHRGSELANFPTDDDHDWHELVLDDVNLTEAAATLTMSSLIRSLSDSQRIDP